MKKIIFLLMAVGCSMSGNSVIAASDSSQADENNPKGEAVNALPSKDDSLIGVDVSRLDFNTPVNDYFKASEILAAGGAVAGQDKGKSRTEIEAKEFGSASLVLQKFNTPIPAGAKIFVGQDDKNQVLFIAAKNRPGIYMYRITYDPNTNEIVQIMQQRD
ncbi:MAG: hypothetical protein EXR85_06385 [Xanthomonadales bacterium]|nr:hypothetical protein [Xanthomonadales bacterium]